MTAVVPKVTVTLEEGTKSPGTGEAGKIAVIGAFKTTSTTPTLFTSLAKAQKTWGKDETFDGCACLPFLFGNGATSVLAVNVSTQAEDVWTKTVTAENLAASLAKIKGEDWDILCSKIPTKTPKQIKARVNKYCKEYGYKNPYVKDERFKKIS
jgi:hypothetical protein